MTELSSPIIPAGHRGYVICSEHRSGSTLLCQWLASTGVLGHPNEYFATTETMVAIERDPALLAGVLACAATPNGIYGIKLFSQQFDGTMAARWIERLPQPRFIHLERRDLLGQAISLVRARQTGRYFAHEKQRASANYDRRAISRQIGRLAEAHARWRLYFARNDIEVLWLAYEDIVRDPDGAIDAVARHIGYEEPAAINPELIRLTIQRDALSVAWRARYVAEVQDLGYLDHPLGAWRVRARRLARDAGVQLRRFR